MGWRERLQQLLLAGGALGCTGPTSPTYCGNANPDPCICGRPEQSAVDKMNCDLKMACESDGGVWDDGYSRVDGGTSDPRCHPAADGGAPDAP